MNWRIQHRDGVTSFPATAEHVWSLLSRTPVAERRVVNCDGAKLRCGDWLVWRAEVM